MKANQMVKAWDTYNQNLDVSLTAKEMNVSYGSVNYLVKDLQRVLAGSLPQRVKGRTHILTAAKIIKSREAKTEETTANGKHETSPSVESSESKINRLFDELKQAVEEYAYELALEKNKEIVEAAQKSNIVGTLRSRLGI